MLHDSMCGHDGRLIPPAATAPALIVVGYMTIEPVVRIGFQEPTDGIPAFLTILTMPVAYSIVDGIFVGIASYVVLKAGTGRITQVSALMRVIAVLLVSAKVLQALNL